MKERGQQLADAPGIRPPRLLKMSLGQTPALLLILLLLVLPLLILPIFLPQVFPEEFPERLGEYIIR